jgi:hypothetical protein
MRLKYADGLSHEKRLEDINFIKVIMGAEVESLRQRVEERQTTLD